MLPIRLARSHDAAPIAVMSRELIESGLGWSWTPQRVRARIRDRNCNVIVAGDRSAIAAFALMQYFEEHAHLLLFAVRPAARRRGLGRAMWAWLEKTAIVAGISTVHLEVRAQNTAARDFYRSIGFVDAETVKGYYSGREAALRMRRRLFEPAHSGKR